jgi:hypothetical protein
MIVVCVGGHVENYRCAAAAVDRDQGTGSKQSKVVSEGRAGGQAATWQVGSDTDGRHGHALHGQAVIPKMTNLHPSAILLRHCRYMDLCCAVTAAHATCTQVSMRIGRKIVHGQKAAEWIPALACEADHMSRRCVTEREHVCCCFTCSWLVARIAQCRVMTSLPRHVTADCLDSHVAERSSVEVSSQAW